MFVIIFQLLWLDRPRSRSRNRIFVAIRSIPFEIRYTDFSFYPLSAITFYVTVGLKSAELLILRAVAAKLDDGHRTAVV